MPSPAALSANDHTYRPDVSTSSPEYARRFTGEVGEYFLRTQAQSVNLCLPALPRPTVLEVGGGHLQVTRELISKGCQPVIHGSEACAAARLKEDSLLSAGVPFVASDIYTLPFVAQSFDVTIALRLLAHCDNWRALIGELCRVARHTVIIDYAELYSTNILSPLLFSVKKRIEKNTRPFLCHRFKEIEQAFQKEGFTVSKKIPQFVIPMGLHRAIGNARLSERAEHLVRTIGVSTYLGTPVILSAQRGI